MRTKLRFILLWIPILFQQLFMKKLLISSKLFVFLMSTINFSSLRLDNFIQLLNTSSVIIGLEFVFSNLCLTISVNLLSLSFQNNPDLLIFWAATRIFFDVWDEWIKMITNKSPCSETDRRRLTGRQTFVKESDKRVYGSLHLLAPGWTVVKRALYRWCHASSRTVLARGFLDEQFSGLWDAGRWAHDLWEGRTRQGCQGPH